MKLNFADINNLCLHLNRDIDSLGICEPFLKAASSFSIRRVAFRIFINGEGLAPVVLYNEPQPKGEANTFVRHISDDESVYLRIYHAPNYTPEDSDDTETIELIANIILTMISMHRVFDTRNKAYKDRFSSNVNIGTLSEKLQKLILRRVHNDYYVGYLNIKSTHTMNVLFGYDTTSLLLHEYSRQVSLNCDYSINELFAHLGGDTFAFLIHAKNIDRFLKFAVSVPVTVTSKEDILRYTIQSRIGVARINYEISGPSEAIGLASEAYKKTRQPGSRDIYRTESDFFVAGTSEASLARSFAEDLNAGKLLVYYQPIYKIQDGKRTIVAAEALARWRRSGEMIKPSDFLPIAEKLGLTTIMDLFILERSCENLRKWIDEGRNVIPISCNFSHNDLAEGNLSDEIIRIIDKYGLDHRLIIVEFTEAGFHNDYETLTYIIENLCSNRIRVTIDNFGSGYTSLNLLDRLKFDFLKINLSSLGHIDDRSITLIDGLVNLSGSLGIGLVCQGPMSKETFDKIQTVGCLYYQSELLEKALSERFFIKLISN